MELRLIEPHATVNNSYMLDKYRILYRLADPGPNTKDAVRLKNAFRLIANAYQDIPGNAAAPYIWHPIEIAIITADKFRISMDAILSALLQDTIRDGKTSATWLEQAFGVEVSTIVTKLNGLSEVAHLGISKQAVIFKRLLSSFSPNNVTIILIKIAEYLHKMRLLSNTAASNPTEITAEIRHIYIPLAHQLGLHHVQLELEDLCLKFEHRRIYDDIANKIQATSATKQGFLERFTGPIHAALQQEQFHQYVIKGRTKSVASIWHKLNKRNIPFEEMHDLYAVRIIFESKRPKEYSNCWMIYELITALYEPRLDRIRDWITYPKDSGYEALHITVMSPEGQWVEVQIRTTRMDDNAENGHAAHWKYKDQQLAKELADIDQEWLLQARSFLSDQWKQHTKSVDIRIHDLYHAKPRKK